MPERLIISLDSETLRLFTSRLERLEHLTREGFAAMSAELDRLTTEVSETKTVIDSAIALLGQLSDLIRQNATDPAALTKLADDLDAQQTDLAAAVVANTPAAAQP